MCAWGVAVLSCSSCAWRLLLKLLCVWTVPNSIGLCLEAAICQSYTSGPVCLCLPICNYAIYIWTSLKEVYKCCLFLMVSYIYLKWLSVDINIRFVSHWGRVEITLYFETRWHSRRCRIIANQSLDILFMRWDLLIYWEIARGETVYLKYGAEIPLDFNKSLGLPWWWGGSLTGWVYILTFWFRISGSVWVSWNWNWLDYALSLIGS